MKFAVTAAAVCVAILASIAMPTAQAASSALAAAGYADLSDRLETDAEIEAWYGALRNLNVDFDQICGDTFCEGDYSNIQPLRLVCSVAGSARRIGQCVWTFAASNQEIDAGSGRVQVQPKVWKCKIPLVPGTTARALIGALAQERPLYAALPGTSVSIYDGLSECL